MTVSQLQIKQFRYANDNLGYLIHGQKSAVAVDGALSMQFSSLSAPTEYGLTM
jgi:hypothetical protein